MRSNLIALFIQANECSGQFIALPELLHRQNVALLRAEQIPSNAARFDGVAHHQCRNAGRICSDGRVGSGTNEEAALRNDIFQFRRGMIVYQNQPPVLVKIIVQLLERNTVVIIGPNDMWDQGNIGVGIIQNVLNQCLIVGIGCTVMSFADNDMWADIDADNIAF